MPNEKDQLAISPVESAHLQSVEWNSLTWIHIETPTKEDVKYLASRFGFHPLNLEDMVSKIQRPKIDEHSDHLFLVFHFPSLDAESHLEAAEFDVFIGGSYLVTVDCSGHLRTLAKTFKECQLSTELRQTLMGKGTSLLLYSLLDRHVDDCFPILDRLITQIDKLETEILKRTDLAHVHAVAAIRRDLITFRRIVHPLIPLMEALSKRPWFRHDGQDITGIYFSDISDHLHSLWDTLEDYYEVISGFTDMSNWLSGHRIQEQMRVLTLFMAVLLPVEVLFSYFGSNTAYPGKDTIAGFSIELALAAFVAGIMVWFLHRRKFM